MVVDHIENRESYFPLGSGIERALRYLAVTDFSSMDPGKYDIDGDNIFAIVDEYVPHSAEGCHLEAHKKYVDVQFLVHGREEVGYAPLREQKVAESYSEDKDVAFYEGVEAYIKLQESMFAIFYPTDLHKPGLGEVSSAVKKVVVKIAV